MGNYPIIVSQGTLSSANYSFSFTNGMLTVTDAPVAFVSFFVNSSSLYQMRLIVPPSSDCVIQVSSNLFNWTSLTTSNAPDGIINFTDTNTTVNLGSFDTRFVGAPIDVLAKVGGFEIAGIAGLILGAARYRIPVVIDGFISTAGALFLVVFAFMHNMTARLHRLERQNCALIQEQSLLALELQARESNKSGG